MNKARKVGIVLIVVGFCIPIIFLIFVSNYDSNYSVMGNIQRMEIVLRGGTIPPQLPEPLESSQGFLVCRTYENKKAREECEQKALETHKNLMSEYNKRLSEYKSEIAIPYRYIVAFGMFLALIGIEMIIFGGSKKGR
jgi:hypothetical protein